MPFLFLQKRGGDVLEPKGPGWARLMYSVSEEYDGQMEWQMGENTALPAMVIAGIKMHIQMSLHQ